MKIKNCNAVIKNIIFHLTDKGIYVIFANYNTKTPNLTIAIDFKSPYFIPSNNKNLFVKALIELENFGLQKEVKEDENEEKLYFNDS